jgi:hypothetical protein
MYTNAETKTNVHAYTTCKLINYANRKIAIYWEWRKQRNEDACMTGYDKEKVRQHNLRKIAHMKQIKKQN